MPFFQGCGAGAIFFWGGGKGAEADPKKAWPQLQTYFGLKTAGFLNYFENTNILVSKLM